MIYLKLKTFKGSLNILISLKSTRIKNLKEILFTSIIYILKIKLKVSYKFIIHLPKKISTKNYFLLVFLQTEVLTILIYLSLIN